MKKATKDSEVSFNERLAEKDAEVLKWKKIANELEQQRNWFQTRCLTFAVKENLGG